MLIKQLWKIKDHLAGKESLNKVQKELLLELEWLSDNDIIQKQFTQKGRIFKSFAPADSLCPNCGKVY